MKGNGPRLFGFIMAAVIVVVVAGIVSVSVSTPWGLWAGTSGAVEGRVFVDGVGPVSGARVVLDGVLETVSDGEGVFSFPLVPFGGHHLTARHESLRYDGDAFFRVKKGRTRKIDLILEENTAIGETVGMLTAADFPVPVITITEITGNTQLAVLCDLENGIWTVDVSNPESPAILGRNSDDRNCSDGVLAWPFVYIGSRGSWGPYSGIAVYDLSNPAAPILTGEAGSAQIEHVFLDGNRLYAAEDGIFQIFDVTSPGAPFLLGGLPLGGAGVTARGDYAFLTTDAAALTVIDVADPAAPRVVWNSVEGGDPSRDIAVAGNYAFALGDRTLFVYDILDPADPRLVDAVDRQFLVDGGASLAGEDWMFSWRGVVIDDDIAYLTAHDEGVFAVDFADARRPDFSWQSDGLVPFAMNLYVSGSHAYVASRDYGMRIIWRSSRPGVKFTLPVH